MKKSIKFLSVTLMTTLLFNCSNQEETLNNEEVVASSDDKTVVSTESAKTPLTLLKLNKWKLTVPKDGNNDDKADEIYVDEDDNTIQSDGSLLDLHNEGKYYYYKSGTNWVNFRADANDPSTPNSNNPRCELREMNNGGGSEIAWDLNSSVRRGLECTLKIVRTPDSGTQGKVCFMQIHGDEDHDGWDDVIRLQIRADDNATTGDTGTVYVMGDVVNDSADDLFSYTLGDTLKMTLVAKSGKVYVYDYIYDARKYSDPADGNPIRTYNSDSEKNYFKAGTYLQSTPSSGYGETSFNRIKFRIKS